MTRAEWSKSASSRTRLNVPLSVWPSRSVSRTSRPMSCATSCTVPLSTVTIMPSHSRLVSTVTSVRKFWDRTARLSSMSSTNSNASAVSSLEPSS